MKIFPADKVQPRKRSKAKQTKATSPSSNLRKTDWDVLMQHDRFTGKLDLSSKEIIQDPNSVKRLLEAEMIFPDGYLTPEARKKCVELTQNLNKPESVSAAAPELPEVEQPIEPVAKEFEKLTASDWAVLMKYDRETGNLLKYDPETGQLDNTSRAILKDPSIVQRLIDNNMILPGGWLTPEAKKECTRIEEKLNAQTDEKSFLSKPEDVSDSEVEDVLSPQPVSKDDPRSKSRSERLSKALPGSQKKGHLESISKSEPKSEHKQDLQAFFMNLSDGIPERSSKDLTGSEQLSGIYPERKSGDEQYSERNSERRPIGSESETQETQVTAQKKQNFAETAASYKAGRNFNHNEISKSDIKRYDKPRRKRRGPDSTDGDFIKPPPISLRDIFHLVFKRKVQILLFFLAVVITVTIGTLLAEPTYEASTQILVKLGRESVFVPTTGNTRPVINSSREERINSEIEIIKSRSLAEKVVLALGPIVIYENLKEQEPGIIDRIKAPIFPEKNKELTPDERAAQNLKKATANLQKNLSVKAVKLSNIIQVSLQHQNPRMVSMAVNKFAEIYLGHHLEVHKTPQSHKFFQEQSELLKKKLEQSETKLKELKKQHHITSLEQERTLLLGQASALHTDLNRTLSQEAETEKRIRQLRRQLTVTPQTIAMGEEVDRNQNLIGILETRLVELELEEKDLLAKYTDQSRLVQNVKEEIRIVTEKLAAQEKKSYGKKRTGANPTFQRLQEELYRNEAELNALKAKGQIQKTQLANYQVKLEKLNQIDVKLNQLQQQVDVNRENYRLYLTKFEESRISDAMDTEKIASVSIIESARPPGEPVSPNMKLNVLLAIFLGAIGGLGMAFFVEYLDDKIEKIEDVEETLGLPVLASIPVIKNITEDGSGQPRAFIMSEKDYGEGLEVKE